MIHLLRVLRVAILLFIINRPFLPEPCRRVWILLVLLAVWIMSFALPRRPKSGSLRLHRMMKGYELVLSALTIFLAEMAVLIAGAWRFGWYFPESQTDFWIAAVITLVFAALMLIAGFLRIVFTSKHLRIVWRLMLLALWWVPLFNIFVFAQVLKKVRGEYLQTKVHDEIMEAHAENDDCATKYPILLVHGIFFRDWQLINYWGRIPKELTRCGARIYYGGQQSAAPVEESAGELAESIRRVIAETGAEKLNIVAHSKGGLDSRFAISRLGMAPYVASLTTVNTPHRGCVWARTALESMPKSAVRFIEKRYNSLFTKLGDKSPDVLGGVRDLTDVAAARFNETVPDSEGVYYQSVMSLMSKASSAPFPLNVCWRLVTKHDREPNDGLVARSSAPWGSFLGEISVSGRRGVSHGDMVDLLREDIKGFDVAAFYASLLRGLKLKGF